MKPIVASPIIFRFASSALSSKGDGMNVGVGLRSSRAGLTTRMSPNGSPGVFGGAAELEALDGDVDEGVEHAASNSMTTNSREGFML
jgi:hypothetical protein